MTLISFLRGTMSALTPGLGRNGTGLAVTSLLAGTLPARLYAPDHSQRHPPILFFHGGGFLAGSLDSHDALCRELALSSGLRVLAIAYRLAPEHPAPVQFDDAITACRWVLSEPRAIGGNTKQLVLSGDSAGGYLAARCSIALNAHCPSVVGQILFYPLITMDAENWESLTSAFSRWIGGRAVAFMRRNLGKVNYPSLLSCALGQLPQTVIVSGKALDPVYSSVVDFSETLRESGVAVDHFVVSRLFHGELNFSKLSGTASRAIVQAGEAARRWFAPQNSGTPDQVRGDELG